MSASQNNPILNRPPDADNFANGLRFLLNQQTMKFDGMMPAKIISYDRTKNLATVQPQIMLVDTDNNTRMRNQIAQVPVFSFGGGGYHINFPIKAGDLGWLLAADRDISLFMETLDAAKPNTMRRKSFGDGLFVPDAFWKYSINGADSDSLVIQSTDGSTRIAIKNGEVTITAPGQTKIDSPLTMITGNVLIQQNLTVTGMTMVNGGFNATGGGNLACVLPQSTTIGGIAVYVHGHVQTAVNGQRTSGGMVS